MTIEEIVDGSIERIRREEPGCIAVLVYGSRLDARAGDYSDLDLLALTRDEPLIPYRAWLFDLPDGRLFHVSTGADAFDEWRKRTETPVEWSFYLPVVERARLLWGDEQYSDSLRDPDVHRPPGTVELEDFIEAAGKVKNAYVRSDSVCLRYTAQLLARYSASVLRPLNVVREVEHPMEALATVLDFEVAPHGYKYDMFTCLGLSESYRTNRQVYQAALRIAIGTVSLLESAVSRVRGKLEPDLEEYLADGSLMRYLMQGIEIKVLSDADSG